MDPDLDVACYDSSHYRWMLFVGCIRYTSTLDDPRTKLQLSLTGARPSITTGKSGATASIVRDAHDEIVRS
ncbi:hypothetical protein SPRG_20694 [Saprolegnia parasitica CBS 223.65]|uniref:Uncharacterized protein n=1 Tax=Saprolegnia parasitica (strain CBS 223.65) TaxID=695850 RepID=A0A067CG87_SAPPC|nr:hypothetical protein SPRG_20694 [Saprolegnia parasitica CBS 223.65]KDO25571.1 hypothetical protein SPRG_20694 [Saprolegnia parasitica CBS 223.65]|eukprot:XP_012203789.1 hypothetical protein SPRG_20694 [Saprolegnia parasitica CBS 223.65]